MKKISLTLFVAAFLIIGAGCGPNSKESTNKKSASETSVNKDSTKESKTNESEGDFVKSAKDATFDGKTLKGNTYTIKITDHKVIQPGEVGNEYGETPVIAFWYDTLVSPDYKSETPINPTTAWMMNFTAVQDNDPNKVNKLSITTLPDNNYTSTQTAEIKPGGTVPNAVAYKLTDNETPVTLTAEDLTGTEYGKIDIPIK